MDVSKFFRDMTRQILLSTLLLSALLPDAAATEPRREATPELRQTRRQRGKRVTQKKDTEQNRPDLPEAGSLTGIDSAPETHPEKYREFLEKLRKQAEKNDADTSEAMAVALAATGNEFCCDAWMKKAAADGSVVAMHYMGMTSAAKNTSPELRYLRGERREALLREQQSNAVAAAEWLRKAAEKKYVPAMLDYSTFLRNGIGTKKDEQAANRMMMEAARSGTYETRFAWLLQNGRMKCWADRERPEVGGEIKRGNHLVVYYMSNFAPDSRTQLEWIQDAVKKGSAKAMYALSVVMHNTKPQESLKLLRAAVTMHDTDAMLSYGLLLVSEPGEFHKQTGLQQNVQLGCAMLRLSGMLCNVQCRRTLAKAYYRGDFGFPRDKAKTYAHLKWLNSAQKDPISLAAEGFMLLTGDGAPQDAATGLRYITLAANARYSYANAMLAYAHYKGLGVPQNKEMSVEILQEAAAAGFAHAYVYIAFLTAKGLHGKAPDSRGAERYINIAAINLGKGAKAFFDELMKMDEWVLPPFPLEKQ